MRDAREKAKIALLRVMMGVRPAGSLRNLFVAR